MKMTTNKRMYVSPQLELIPLEMELCNAASQNQLPILVITDEDGGVPGFNDDF